MSKVQVTIPAVLTHLAAGPQTLGLALNVHAHLEMRTRPDGQLKVQWGGEGADSAPAPFRNPILKAAARVFQLYEKAPAGLEIGLQNGIPMGAGLHLEAALTLGGIIAANNLVGGDLGRDDIIELAAQMGVPRVVALSALLGGLNLCLTTPDGAHLHQSLEPPPLRTIILVPELSDYQPHIPPQVAQEAALYNIARLPFLMQALLNGDLNLLETILPDPLYEPALSAPIPGYQAAKEAARQAGATLTIASNGPSLLIFAAYNHTLVLEAVREALANKGIKHSRHWTVSLDSQGVTVSLLG